jgi:hypothetical protein
MLDATLLLPGANERRHQRFSRPVHAVRLDQKQFALSKLEEWFAAL